MLSSRFLVLLHKSIPYTLYISHVIIFIRTSRGRIVKHSARGERIEQASVNVQLIKNQSKML